MVASRRAALIACLSSLAALGAFWPALAAHGTSPLKVAEEIAIAAPPATVWAVVSDFQGWDWLPGVTKIAGSGGNVPDQGKIELTLDTGATIAASLTKLDAERLSLGYHLDRVDLKTLAATNYSGVVTVRAAEGGGSIVEWKSRFYRGYPMNNPPPELNDDVAVAAVTAMNRANLAALKAKVEGRR